MLKGIWKWNEANLKKEKNMIYCLSKNLVRDDTNSDYNYTSGFLLFFLDPWLLRHCSWNLTCFGVNILYP